MKMLTDHVLRQLPAPEAPRGMRGLRVFDFGPCTIMVAREARGGERARWHLSIACVDRLPTWEEVHDARYKLVPHDVTMAMILPPPDEYVNVHEFCLHVWEIDDVPGWAI